jgi:hypothetical protein
MFLPKVSPTMEGPYHGERWYLLENKYKMTCHGTAIILWLDVYFSDLRHRMLGGATFNPSRTGRDLTDDGLDLGLDHFPLIRRFCEELPRLISPKFNINEASF